MFVPLAVLAQNESTLYTPEDVILALDRWVLPTYPDHETNHPANTKIQCMGVLNSFYQAGKFHLSLKPKEIEDAVNAFMEDRLWVSRDVLETLVLLPNQRPETWMSNPTLFKVLRAMGALIKEAAFVFYNLAAAFVTYSWYSRKPARPVKVPNPTERKATTLQLVKKDS